MLIYNLVIRIYGMAVNLAALKKTKARQWVQGRKNWRNILSSKITTLNSEKKIWVHCASYGEFEQGRPLMEAIRKKHPDYKIILSFFSPSGFEAFKDWNGADVICYLPLDTVRNARDFIAIVKPKTVIFIKYEFWVNFLFELKRQGIPTYLVSAVFKPHHPFFKIYGGLFRRSLKTFTKIFIQDEDSGKLLLSIGIQNFEVSGDTRFDRVLDIKSSFEELPAIKQFKGNGQLIVAGSTWPKDEELVLKAFLALKNHKVKLLLVPHNIDEKSIKETVRKLKQHNVSFSLFSEGIDNMATVLVLDTMGLLSRTYFYADCAYIGGGYNGGLHNSLEAAVYGIPLAFYGEKYVRYNEAVELLDMKAASIVKNEGELTGAFNEFLTNDEFRKNTAKKTEAYFRANSNVTEKILASIGL